MIFSDFNFKGLTRNGIIRVDFIWYCYKLRLRVVISDYQDQSTRWCSMVDR